MKIYMARRPERVGASPVYVEIWQWPLHLEEIYELPPRLDLCNHSPDGFGWGYAGSGAAQLAFAILLDLLGEERLHHVQRLHQQFKARTIMNLPIDDGWSLPSDEIHRTMVEMLLPKAPPGIAGPTIYNCEAWIERVAMPGARYIEGELSWSRPECTRGLPVFVDEEGGVQLPIDVDYMNGQLVVSDPNSFRAVSRAGYRVRLEDVSEPIDQESEG